MLYWMCGKTLGVPVVPTNAQLEHAIRRNFGGNEDLNVLEIFREKIPEFVIQESVPWQDKV